MEAAVTNRKILVVEDNERLRREIAAHFCARKNTVLTAADYSEAKEIYRREPNLDAVILDVVLPDGSGLNLLGETRENPPPVVVLSDLNEDDDILSGIGAGAADYVTKPCSMRVLEARLALRLLPKKDALVSLGDFTADANTRTVTFRGAPVTLTSSEFNILYFLIRHADTFYSATEIYENVWGAPSLGTTTVNRHLSTLRRKLKEISPKNSPIVTEFGKGYCFPSPPPPPLSSPARQTHAVPRGRSKT